MKMSQFKVGTRLIAGFVVVAVLALAVGVVGIVNMGRINDMADALYEKELVGVSLVKEANINLIYLGRARGSLLLASDAQERAKAKEDMAKFLASTQDYMNKAKPLFHSEKAKKVYADFENTWRQYESDTRQVMALADKEKFSTRSDEINAAVALIRANANKLDDWITDLAKIKEENAKEASVETTTIYHASVKLMAGLVVLAVALGVGIGALISRSITKPLAKAVKAAEGLGRGELDVDVKAEGRDETAQLLQAMEGTVGTLKQFAAAQVEMTAKHDAGNISHRMPVDQFHGAYRDMAEKLNALVAGHIAVKMRVVDVVGSYARGDLSVDMDRLPGEKAKITEAIDGVKASLQSINGDILKLATAAAAGDFTARGDVSKYQHDFRKMIEALNRLMEISDKGLADVVRALDALARGDLTARITDEYQGTFGRLKEGSNETSGQLGQIVGQIREAAEAIATASSQIAQGNADLSQRTEEQASSLQETASSMEQLTGTVKQNAENAKQANQLAMSASGVASQGGQVVSEVVKTMGDISDSAKKIADIISVIDGIAFQTNILALNAAVEAARAGEQGRGFAVVAGEVRTLAQRSADAAKEIKTLIGDSVEKVEAGGKLVADAGQTMGEVVMSVKRVADIISEITAASVEQSTGIEQVNQAIAQMDKVTQQNAALVEEAAAAAESMKEQAAGLTQSVSVFHVEGAGARLPKPQAPKALAAPEIPAKAVAAKSIASKPAAPKANAKPAVPKRGATTLEHAEGEWKEI